MAGRQENAQPGLTDHAAVVPLNGGWSDIGSWSALWEVSGTASVIIGDKTVLLTDLLWERCNDPVKSCWIAGHDEFLHTVRSMTD